VPLEDRRDGEALGLDVGLGDGELGKLLQDARHLPGVGLERGAGARFLIDHGGKDNGLVRPGVDAAGTLYPDAPPGIVDGQRRVPRGDQHNGQTQRRQSCWQHQ